MDTMAIAAAVTGCLAPVLPYLIKVGEKESQVAGGEVASGLSETAKALWQLLSPVVATQPAVTAAVREVATTPDDFEAQAALRFQLQKMLAADERLAAVLMQLLATAKPATGHPPKAPGECPVT